MTPFGFSAADNMDARGAARPDDWVRLYRSGISGAGVALACDVDNILDVLNALAGAKRHDPSLEGEHAANLLLRRTFEVPDYVAAQRGFSPAWRRRITELTAYVADHGRMPRQGGGDEAETSLGRWLHAQRLKVTKGTLESRHRAALDAVGAWDSADRKRRDETKFPVRLKDLADFQERHRRLPSFRNRADEHESTLGLWLHTQRQDDAGGRLPDMARDALDETVPDWNS